jgi:chromosome segregation ATPase
MVNKKLIRKIQENYSKQFKKEFGNYHDDAQLNYYERAVGPYVMIFTNLCQDLKMIDLDYFENNHGVLRKELISYIALHLLSLKEEDARNTLEAEQIKFDKRIEAYANKLDQRTQDKLRRDDEILSRENEIQRREEEIIQEKELYEKEVKRVKEELEHAHTKIDGLKIAVQCYEQNKDSSEKEKREIGGPVHEHNKCMCDEKIDLILQKLEQNKCMCKKKYEDKYEKEDPERTKEKSKYSWRS